MALTLSSCMITCSKQKSSPFPSSSPHNSVFSMASSFKPLMKKEWKQLSLKLSLAKPLQMIIKNILDAFVDSTYKFVDQPTFHEGNFAPVDEIKEMRMVEISEGEVPQDFPEGVYIRNGSNYLYPTKTEAISIFGKTAYTSYEGDGMLHATYFNKDIEGKWIISYKNKYVESKTFLIDKTNNKYGCIPSADGQPFAILVALILNLMRFGKAARDICNTNVFEHGGKIYAITENHSPYEIDPSSLNTLNEWSVNEAWDRPFTSHPKKVPSTGELVMMGCHIFKPYFLLGVISADGKQMLHKVDLKFKSGANIIHDVGVTENYNIILDYPQKFGIERPILGKRFIEFDQNAKSRIGVMPRFGDEESILWFNVKNHCTYHLINCFEDDDKVIVRGCKLLDTIITNPDDKIDRSEWYRRAYIQHDESSQDYDPSKDGVLFSRPYEWRLNLKTNRVEEGYLIENGVAMDFPVINNRFTGIKNKYSYTQVADSIASSTIGMFKYKMFAKLYFDEHDKENNGNIKVEYHVMEDNHFCSGIEFVKKQDGIDEDDGWVVCYVHDENKNQSKVYIIDAKNFSKEPVAKLKLPQRVPYGYHGIYLYK